MADPRESTSRFDRLKKKLVWLSSQLYFLRFPLLTALALIGLPYLGLYTSLSELLASLFVSDQCGVFLVSFVAFTTAWAILATWRLIALYGDERFSRDNEVAEFSGEEQKRPPAFSVKLWQALLAALTALPVTIAVIYKTVQEQSQLGWGRAVWLAALGLLCSAANGRARSAARCSSIAAATRH